MQLRSWGVPNPPPKQSLSASRLAPKTLAVDRFAEEPVEVIKVVDGRSVDLVHHWPCRREGRPEWAGKECGLLVSASFDEPGLEQDVLRCTIVVLGVRRHHGGAVFGSDPQRREYRLGGQSGAARGGHQSVADLHPSGVVGRTEEAESADREPVARLPDHVHGEHRIRRGVGRERLERIELVNQRILRMPAVLTGAPARHDCGDQPRRDALQPQTSRFDVRVSRRRHIHHDPRPAHTSPSDPAAIASRSTIPDADR